MQTKGIYLNYEIQLTPRLKNHVANFLSDGLMEATQHGLVFIEEQ